MDGNGEEDDCPAAAFPIVSLSRALWDLLLVDEVDSVEQPHIVIYRSHLTGVIDYTGPYGCAIEALSAAEELQRQTEEPCAYTVARLAPPV